MTVNTRLFTPLALLITLGLIMCLFSGCDNQNPEAIPTGKSSLSSLNRSKEPDTAEQDNITSTPYGALRIAATFPEPGRWKKPERILYVGLPETDRAKDFTLFLKRHFDYVETASYSDFSDPKSNGFDVTILDYDGTDVDTPRSNISQSFSRPVITLGAPGASICSHLSLKTGYL